MFANNAHINQYVQIFPLAVSNWYAIHAVGIQYKYNAMLLWHYIFLHVLHLLTFLLLTYSKEQHPSSETSRFSVSQDIFCILCNPKVRYCVYNG
jgi:hypothetical protein